MIRTGIGGWVYPDWRRGNFYPAGLPHKDELGFASRALGAIEINATFRRLQTPESFRKWRAEVPADFVFAVKGSAFVTNRKVLASARESIGKFFAQGLEELGDQLGPIVWQMAHTKQFEAEDFAAFLALLPRQLAGRPVRHAVEAGHESFDCAEFADLMRAAGLAIVYLEQDERCRIAQQTTGFTYLRCKKLQHRLARGYPPAELDRIARLCRTWGEDGDVFAFMINGAKERAPAAAKALAQRIKGLE